MHPKPSVSGVYVVKYNKEILNRSLLYCAMPCVRKQSYQEGDLCSVRWQNLCKGKPGGFFQSAMIVHIWLDGSEWHTKVNRSGAIHMTGVPSEEMARRIANKLSQILTSAAEYINWASSCPLFREAADWLIENSIGPMFPCVNTFALKNDADLGSMEFCEIKDEPSITWPASYPPKYTQILEHLRVLCDDVVRNTNAPHGALESRIRTFIDADPQQGGYVIAGVKFCNVVYRSNLGYRVNRYKLEAFLTKLGYDVHYPNIVAPYVTVYFSTEEGTAKVEFGGTGSVALSCTSNTMAERTYVELMSVMCSNCSVFAM